MKISTLEGLLASFREANGDVTVAIEIEIPFEPSMYMPETKKKIVTSVDIEKDYVCGVVAARISLDYD